MKYNSLYYKELYKW